MSRPAVRPVLAAWVPLVLGLLAAGQTGPRAAPQDPAPTPPATQTFRSGVQIIEVDAFVTDRGGQFVRDLTADDFEILEDGVPQTIRSFSFVDLPIEPRTPPAADAEDAPEPDVVTNDTPEGRIYVLLMDAPSTASPGNAYRLGPTYDAYVKRFARQFVEESVARGDYVAVVHAQGTFSDSQTFTTSTSRLLASIERYGQGLNGDMAWLSRAEQVARNMHTYRAIQDLSERLGAMSGRRKAILWIGGQMSFTHGRTCLPSNQLPCGPDAHTGVLLAAHRDAINAATRHNVAIYPIDPSGLTVPETINHGGLVELERAAALRMVAEDTGGLAVVNTNNLTGGYQAIVRDNSTYYVLAYVPAVEHRDGRFHDIQVRVRRPDLRVRARKGYFAPRPDAETAPARSLPEGVTLAARDALRMPVPVRGLALDVVAAPFKDAAGEFSVVIGGQVTGDLRLDPSEAIGFAYQVFDIEGRTQTGAYRRFTLVLQPEARAQVAETGIRFLDRLALPPGRYELRLVADQPDGAVGSVVVPLDVPKFDEALSLSGVLLAASSAAGDLTLHEDATAQAALGMAPTTRRVFPQGDVLGAFVEVYTDDRRTTADAVTVTGIVTSTDGTEVMRESAWRVRSDVADDAAARQWGFTLDLNLADVPPGRYVLDVEAVSARRPDRPVRRRIPCTVEE